MPTGTATRKESQQPKKQPEHKIRVGSTVATIWLNESENSERPYYSTTVVRIWKNDQDEYVESNSFLENQLLELGHAASMAVSWIVERQAQERAERRG